MNPQTLQYLKQDEIGKVIAKGLASLYTQKPQKPVKYLAEWLLSYSHNRRQMQKLMETQKSRQASLNIFQETAKINQLKVQQDKKIEEALQNKIDQFKNLIKDHQYQLQLLEEVLPQFIQQHTDITGAYIGELNYPKKEVTEEDDSETAHLDQTAEKLINYIGSSKSHKELMMGKTLPLTKGVTAKVFTLDEEVPPPSGQEGQQQAPAPKQKYVYIPNVVKNQSMHYFHIPRFGAYLSVPLIYDSYLSEEIFDVALEAKNKYYADLKEFEDKQKEDIEQLTTEKEQLEKKINDLKQKNAEEATLEPEIAQLARVQEELRARQAETFEEVPPQLQLNQPKFAVCVDNIGKDKELSEKDIKFITDLVQHFKASWTNKQKELLSKDIDTHIQLIKGLPEPIDVLYENINKEFQEISEQKTEEINQIENPALKDYKQEEYCLGKLMEHIKTNAFFLTTFEKLKEFRVVKYRNVIQNILCLLGHSKADINQPGKARLNWKDVRERLINESTFNKVLEFIVQGPKEGQFKPYAKTPVLSQLFEAYDEQAIFSYNAGLGALVKYIKAALKHRISNVELRKTQKQKQRAERDEVIAENEKIAEEKAKELQKQKQSKTPEQLESFNEEEWSAKYDETTPPKEVPPEVIDDIDNDM